jgi:1-deoxy-D-xylulose-5-phosphate reductoisomerase
VHVLDIPRLIERVCDRHGVDHRSDPSLEDVLAVDAWARTATREESRGLHPAVTPALPR